jgi:hypothetical protein
MKQSAGIFLILFALFALYLYNTGRAEAIIGVLKDPNYTSPANLPAVKTLSSVNGNGGFDIGGIAGGILGDILGGFF